MVSKVIPGEGLRSLWLSLELLPSKILPVFSCCPEPLKIGWPLLAHRASFLELSWPVFTEHPLIPKLPVPAEG